MDELEQHTLYRGAREYFTWPITATDADAEPIALVDIGVGFSGSIETEPTAYITVPVTSGKFQVLLAGPDGAGSDATVLQTGRHVVWTRVTDNPELIPRPVARIRVP